MEARRRLHPQSAEPCRLLKTSSCWTSPPPLHCGSSRPLWATSAVVAAALAPSPVRPRCVRPGCGGGSARAACWRLRPRDPCLLGRFATNTCRRSVLAHSQHFHGDGMELKRRQSFDDAALIVCSTSPTMLTSFRIMIGVADWHFVELQACRPCLPRLRRFLSGSYCSCRLFRGRTAPHHRIKLRRFVARHGMPHF